MVAAESGDLDALKGAVGDWADDSYLMNESLFMAAVNGHLPCVRVLVENGAECGYWHSPADETVLSIAASKGHLPVMEYLVGKGVSVNQGVSGDKHTPLYSTAMTGQTECAQFLVDSGADLNAKDTFGMTPLMVAAKEGHPKIVKILLDAGADLSLKSRVRKETAFAIAIENNQAGCVQELVEACPEEATRPLKGGLLPLHHSIRHKQNEVACALIDAGVDLNKPDGPWTPIHLAVEMGNVAIVGIMAACGADLNAALPVPKQVTILMLSVCKEDAEMVRAIGSQASCNLNQFDELGRTALYHACKFGYIKSVEVLLEICADVDAHASHMIAEGKNPAPTALHAAILNDHPEVAKLLLAAGCTTNMGAVFEEDGMRNVFEPLHVACLRGSKWAVDMLLEASVIIPDNFLDFCQTHGVLPDLRQRIDAALTAQKKNPGMLKKVCRGVIRYNMGKIDLYPKIKGLDVPFGIKEYLLYNDL